MLKRMLLAEVVAMHLDPSQHETCVVAWRFTGFAKPGARVDLCCQLCGNRVALCQKSVKMIEGGWLLFCRECVALIAEQSDKQIELSEDIELTRDLP